MGNFGPFLYIPLRTKRVPTHVYQAAHPIKMPLSPFSISLGKLPLSKEPAIFHSLGRSPAYHPHFRNALLNIFLVS